jgi:hypothetical protein
MVTLSPTLMVVGSVLPATSPMNAVLQPLHSPHAAVPSDGLIWDKPKLCFDGPNVKEPQSEPQNVAGMPSSPRAVAGTQNMLPSG